MGKLSPEQFNERRETLIHVALADVEPGEAILLLCAAISGISRAAELSDHGTATAVNTALLQIFDA